MLEPNDLSNEELRDIAERALPHWGLSPDAIELVSRSENTVFKLSMPEGRAFALRIHRPGYHSLAELESELIWTEALNKAGIHVPVGVRTLEGPGYATIPTLDGTSSRAVGLVEWMEGELLSSVIECEASGDRIADHFREMGRIMAACHNQASEWDAPDGFTRHAFDLPGYVGEAPFWGRFWDIPILATEQRATLGRAREGIRALLSDCGKDPQSYSMIHADLHAHNVLVRPDGALQIFDFDDAGWGWHQYDLAVALFRLQQRPDYDRIYQAMLAGYRELRPFSSEAEEWLPLFLLLRHLVVISWQWNRPELGRREGLEEWVEEGCRQVEAFGF
ncbi:MAG: phosphotransferase [Chloroflexi bacterium]|nr:phosphotransferase [Chloroflexota bacterium]